ncbi:hypothetical protein [Methylobacterium durans]|uniref:General secretion pathway protein GspI n=1 Tax=Methylobacterium durans TaxID=2202825 RepID=A0A2U8WE23_9HYPH|nr:hypothetical protein [Methylobacterium durans]AWN43730.1 hypothetical protein DK389_28465 [Methylobacterium durans]
MPPAAEEARPAEGGFTLLEFLAAFAILTLFLSAILAALAVAIRGDHQAAFLTLGSALAKGRLAAAGIDYPLRPGTTGGVLPNGYLWQAEIGRYARVPLGQDRSAAGYRVAVTVAEPPERGGRSLTLRSIVLDREGRR